MRKIAVVLASLFALAFPAWGQIDPGSTNIDIGNTRVDGTCTNGFLLYNNAGLAGCISAAAGTGGVAVGTANQLGYYAANGSTISGLATGNNGLLVTSGAGVPSISSTMPNGIALGTPGSGTLTNVTGLPISTGVSGLGIGTATWLGTPSSANLAAAVTDETGSGALVFGQNPTVNITSIGSTITRSLQTRFADMINAADYAVPDSCATDNTSAISAAIATAAASGKGVFFPAATGSYCFSSPIVLMPNVVLYGDGSAQLEYNGISSNPMFTSSATTILYKSGVVGLRMNSAAASIMFDLKSPYQSIIDNVYAVGNSATSTLLSITTNASGDLNPDGNRNAVFNYFSNVVQEGTFGTFIYMSGRGVGSTPTSIVTLNTFMNLNATDIRVIGYNFAEWVDSNYFAGMQRVQINADNAIGAEFNTAAPSSNVGVYANIFDYLAVDTFGTFVNRIGVRMNLTKQNKIGFLFNDPPAEGGSFVISNDTAEIDVKQQKGGTNDTYVYRRRVYEKGGQEINIMSDPFSIRQTWNNAGVVFNSFEIDNIDTASDASSTLASWKVAGSAKFNFFKSGDTIQSGTADIGFAASTNTVSLGIARGRSGDGISGIDFVSDATYTSGGLRITRFSGANGASWFTHRGTGPLSLILSEASSFTISINGSTVVSTASGGMTVTGALTNASMPISCSGQPVGTLWNNMGAVNVCP